MMFPNGNGHSCWFSNLSSVILTKHNVQLLNLDYSVQVTTDPLDSRHSGWFSSWHSFADFATWRLCLRAFRAFLKDIIVCHLSHLTRVPSDSKSYRWVPFPNTTNGINFGSGSMVSAHSLKAFGTFITFLPSQKKLSGDYNGLSCCTRAEEDLKLYGCH